MFLNFSKTEKHNSAIIHAYAVADKPQTKKMKIVAAGERSTKSHFIQKNPSRTTSQIVPIRKAQDDKCFNATFCSPYIQSKSTTQKNHNQLLNLLNQTIAAKQHYPMRALLLGYTGTARISFYLFPDGHIEKIKLQKSSGTTILDEAAQTTIQSITPFLPAKNYLTQAQEFTINIEFQL